MCSTSILNYSNLKSKLLKPSHYVTREGRRRKPLRRFAEDAALPQFRWSIIGVTGS